ncbi:MAG: sugar ABC transporter permease [Lachnospiraceae bacterium]
MRKTKIWRNYLAGYLFILPMVALFVGFVIYPVIYNIIISFFEWNGISQTKEFVGLTNYRALFADPVMATIIKNFLIFAFSTILIQALIGLFFASILIRKIKFADVYKTLIYLPIIATPSIVGNVFSKILETNRGYLNQMLTFFHLDFLCRQWLAEPKIALGCIIFVNIWQWTGYSMLMYYANMLNISQDIYEAAQIDGAGNFKQFTHITFPLLRGTHYTVFIMGMIGSLKTFDIPYVLTNAGPNHATEFFSTYIYSKSFDLFDQGTASAIVVLMLMLAMIITALQLCFYYRNDKDKEAAA